MVASPAADRPRAGTPQPHFTRWEPPAASSREPLSAAAGFAAKGQAGGLIRLSGRIPHAGDTQSIIMSPGQRLCPADLGKAGCSPPARPPRLVTPRRKALAWTTNHIRGTPGGLPAPPPGMIRSRAVASRTPNSAGYAGRAPARS